MATGYPVVRLTHTSAAIAVTSTTVAAENADREYALIINDSDVTVYLALDVPAVLNAGIRLDAGSSLEIGARFGNLDTRQINAIHGGTGTKTLLVTQG